MKINAVGITKDGDLFAIRSPDSVRGMKFWKIYVGNGSRAWFEKNKEVLTATLVTDGKRTGDYFLIGPKEES